MRWENVTVLNQYIAISWKQYKVGSRLVNEGVIHTKLICVSSDDLE